MTVTCMVYMYVHVHAHRKLLVLVLYADHETVGLAYNPQVDSPVVSPGG